jgi:hypothetical protein
MAFGNRWLGFMGECKKSEAEEIFNRYCDLGGMPGNLSTPPQSSPRISSRTRQTLKP